MEIFKIIIVTALCLISIYLAWRCIILTKALVKYHDIIRGLIDDETTREHIRIIAAAMYGLDVEEFDRRLKK